MIKAQELRIGNYVQYEELKNPSKVWIIDCTETSTNTKAKPIPLTEEWVLELGLHESNRIIMGEYRPCYVKFSSGLVASFVLMVNNNSFFVEWIGGGIGIKYIHQLQNLYFALTGEELTIKEANNEQ